MAGDQVEIRLRKLLNNELSLKDKKHFDSAYDSLISILQTPEMCKPLSEQHELLFECVSQIILTSSNQYFHIDQLRFLLDLTSNVCTLSMSQNQIIANWFEHIEECTIENQDRYKNDDNLSEDGIESEEDEKLTNDRYMRSEYDDVHTDSTNENQSSIEIMLSKGDQHRIRLISRQSVQLIECCYTIEERNKTFKLLLSRIRKLKRLHEENISIILCDQESIFYSLVSHVAQNDFLFSNDQYLALYDLKDILLPKKHSLLDHDRLVFCRQRILAPLNIVTEHIKTEIKLQRSIFNDFQEYIIRSTSPILFDLIKYLLKSNIELDKEYLEYFSERILFDMKRTIFSYEQLDELHVYINIRMKRFESHNQEQIWKERLILLNNKVIRSDLNQWIIELDQVLNRNLIEQKQYEKNVVQHPMWYFTILAMTSSNHLNKHQFECVLKSGIQSTLFNSIQKFYFQYCLNQGHAPINIDELNRIKIKIKSLNIAEKKLAYEELKIILDRSKPEFKYEKFEQLDDLIPIINDQILIRLISIVEKISSDKNTFSNDQIEGLLNKFLYQSTIVRPIPFAEQQQLSSFYSRSISLDELKTYSLSTQSDLNDYIQLLKSRPLMRNVDVDDFVIESIQNIFKSREKFSNEQCEELKKLVKTKLLRKSSYRLICNTYEEFRLNKNNLLIINLTILNELLNNILLYDYQAHLDFINLLEDISKSIDFKEITIEFEINRCLLTTIIFIIIDADYSNSSALISFQQRLTTMIEKQKQFFSLLLTQQQYKLITSCSKVTADVDVLINLLKTNLDENNFSNLIYFIRNELKERTSFRKLIHFLICSFDKDFLSIEQKLQLSNLLFRHSKRSSTNARHLLQFLIEILPLKIHSSPIFFLKVIENNQENDQIINQITIMLTVRTAKYATVEWKRAMMDLLKILYDRSDSYDQLIDIALQSSMFQTVAFKQQLESYVETSAVLNDNHTAHRKLFRHLESDDVLMNALAINQLHRYLVNEHLSSEILLPTMVQALQFIFQNSQKFPAVSLDEWAILVANNRGKIFPHDAQCDQLLMDIVLHSLHMPTDTLNVIKYSIQSNEVCKQQVGLNHLLLLLKKTQRNSKENRTKNLPTISNQIYDLITDVVYDEKLNNHQVRQCVTTARNSWLLNSDHRKKLDNI